MTKKHRERIFTIDRLYEIQDIHGELTLSAIMEEFDFLSRRDITQKLNQKRRAGQIYYGKNYTNIKILAPRTIKNDVVIKDNELGRLQSWFLVRDLYGLEDDLQSGQLKASDKVKARQLRYKILNSLQKSAIDFAKLYEEQIGFTLPWQEVSSNG
ncbi:hypothetical protein [Streptococcus himalayensis]|uniref:Uncharacterized protein n=1 Tax=Streptococcus himalayensis TaxID=1888195 RepID=A0A917A8G6_9STRE|nr:hypothetical protein [Streptococcus himalayensis]QBX08398.1 hypothetical protein JavanS257_0008 [Streptococcus satellite phage Javan257]GGE34586.1 hypothetical protein GCM10011510_14890 [Streptococcus himalayensis]